MIPMWPPYDSMCGLGMARRVAGGPVSFSVAVGVGVRLTGCAAVVWLQLWPSYTPHVI